MDERRVEFDLKFNVQRNIETTEKYLYCATWDQVLHFERESSQHIIFLILLTNWNYNKRQIWSY